MLIAIAATLLQFGSMSGSPPSRNDCAVIVAIGKHQFGWGKSPPQRSFFPANGPEGNQALCPWTDFGVVPPRLTAWGDQQTFSIDPPQYDEAKRHATVRLEYVDNHGDRLSFGEVWRCSLTKDAGNWSVVDCKLSAVS